MYNAIVWWIFFFSWTGILCKRILSLFKKTICEDETKEAHAFQHG